MTKLVFPALVWWTVFMAFAAGPETPRPRIVGLTHVAVRVHDLNAARHFYGDLLGYAEAFSVDRNHTGILKPGLAQNEVSSVFFKVNDRQYIVLVPEAKPEEQRYVSYGLETDDAGALRSYLKSKGYTLPEPAATKDPTYGVS